jgi:hypothetical protein
MPMSRYCTLSQIQILQYTCALQYSERKQNTAGAHRPRTIVGGDIVLISQGVADQLSTTPKSLPLLLKQP